MNLFVLADCNNFFVSCERLFNPRLEKKAVVILSSNDGCVISRSAEAKALKIPMGAPYFKIKEFCKQNQVVVLSSNFELYSDLSERVMNILTAEQPNLEIYSIDEAFLKYENSPGQTWDSCIALREKVKKWVGIPISLGIAPTKTLAKIAGRFAKKEASGVFTLDCAVKQTRILEQLPVEEIWGVGPNWKNALHSLGIFTASSFRNADPSQIRIKLGVVGERILWELRGTSCLPLEEATQKKSITCSRSFGKAITDIVELAEALSSHVFRACANLREQNSYARSLCVFLGTTFNAQGTRNYFQASSTLPYPTNDTSAIITASKDCLKKLYSRNQVYKKCGVILLDLFYEEEIALDLFNPINSSRNRLLHQIDAFNAKAGKKSIFLAAMGTTESWKSQSHFRTLRYTTDWNELAIAKA